MLLRSFKLRPSDVLLTTNHLVVVNKPAGVLAQPAGEALRAQAPAPDVLSLTKAFVKERERKRGNVFMAPLHRLDQVASGAVCLARTSKAATRMMELFREREVRKEYLVVVQGILSGTGTVPGGTSYADYWEMHGGSDHSRVDVGKDRRGQLDGDLHWTVINYPISMEGDSPEPSTLMAVRTKTGRKHQIRRQLAGMGHTILGDHLYGSYRHLPPIFKNYPLRPIMLHASGLQFKNPVAVDPAQMPKQKPSFYASDSEVKSSKFRINAPPPRFWRRVLKDIAVPDLVESGYKSYFDYAKHNVGSHASAVGARHARGLGASFQE